MNAHLFYFILENYKYMIVKYESDGIIRVFARTLGKIDLDSEDREKFETELQGIKKQLKIIEDKLNETL